MADLASLKDLRDKLSRKDKRDDPKLQTLLDLLETMLEDDTGQVFAAAPASDVVDERHSGKGRKFLYLNRPPDTLTAVKIGQDPAAPDDTPAVTSFFLDADLQRIIYKADESVFPKGTFNVYVTYRPGVNLPLLAKEAIIEGAVFLYRRIGSEHLRSLSVGELGSVSLLASRLAFLPVWGAARRNLKRRLFF